MLSTDFDSLISCLIRSSLDEAEERVEEVEVPIESAPVEEAEEAERKFRLAGADDDGEVVALDAFGSSSFLARSFLV